jgi:serine phosphatase RsbU (regulator of sigma subunit)
VVVDTQVGTVDCASAGHPSPLIANRQTRCVEPIFERLKNNPALGLFPESTYTVFNRCVLPGELVLLFTDGLLEAPNADFEEFGRDRLIEVLRGHLHEDIALLNGSVVEAVTRFAGQTTLPDDLCLVAVEILANSRCAAPVSHPKGVAGP